MNTSARGTSRPLGWMLVGFLLAVLLSRIFPLGDDNNPSSTDHHVNASAVIPQVVAADDATIASLRIGQPCTPLIPGGRWAGEDSKRIVILDGTQQIRSVTSTVAPIVLSINGNVLTCGHPFEVMTTVTGFYIQFDVNNRGPEIFVISDAPSQRPPYSYQLAPIT